MVRKAPDPIRSANWLAAVFRKARLVWRLWRDSRVPSWVKLIPPVILVYLFFPIDVVPDPLLGLGQLDDLAAIVLGLQLFIALSPQEVVRQHLAELAGRWQVEEPSEGSEVIEGEYQLIDEE
ncbi:MAG: DUF1232 domain-containing protein [Chloroflexota bacterium]|nr:DUF1232 domain-containing protein [Chloroflexota bacterium]